ncbi:MAG: sulfite exporter TauE/SafE family protein [Candidatus Delongbacteria bacterium]|nr:sulfite exporter TauE/SafE family protein [Candidatus Delongbacteria bacterium]
MITIIVFLLIGLAAGVLGGVFGIGGGLIVVPALVFVCKFGQHQAQGTSLAMMLPPIGLLAVLSYHQHGWVNWKAALIICLGFLLGSIFGSRIAAGLSHVQLTRLFGLFLLLVSLKFIFTK